ncbi:MAG: dipeptide epimerase [Planctomycetaceae bacterium]
MKIVEMTAFHVLIPLRKPIKHASHARTETHTVIVRCRLEDGAVGWGEGLPRPYVTGEDIDAAWKIISDNELASRLSGTWLSLKDLLGMLSGFQLAETAQDGRGCFGNSVRCAIELSVLDAACRAEDIPFSAITRLVSDTAAIRQEADWARYSVAFTAMSRWKQIARALLLRVFGFHQSKVKVGVEGVDDVALLRRLRGILGPQFDLRIDANEAWTCENLEERLSELTPFNITSVEQPVRHEDVAGLAKIRPRLEVPIMLDESLCSEFDARTAIEQGTCDLFNIRLSKCGGFLPSLKLAAIAHQAGLGYQLGCQVGETGILSAAGRHFATSIANIRYLEGSFDRFLVKERLTVEDLTFGYGGYAPALTGPGLGVTIDPEALQRVTQREQRVM